MKKIRIAFSAPGDSWHYTVTHPWLLVDHYYHEIKHFIQRGLYGYADSDQWSLDWYLSTWLPHALRRFKTGHSYPGYDEANTSKKWGKLTEKMAQGFEAHFKISDKMPGGKLLEKLQKQKAEGMQLFVKWFGHLWD